MDRRYNPSVPPPIRPQRGLESWMILAIVLGMALGSVGLIAKFVIVPAFAKVTAALEHAGAR